MSTTYIPSLNMHFVRERNTEKMSCFYCCLCGWMEDFAVRKVLHGVKCSHVHRAKRLGEERCSGGKSERRQMSRTCCVVVVDEDGSVYCAAISLWLAFVGGTKYADQPG